MILAPMQPGAELPMGGAGFVTHGGPVKASSTMFPLAFASLKSEIIRREGRACRILPRGPALAATADLRHPKAQVSDARHIGGVNFFQPN
jgi:hypothetical protein